MGDFSIQNLVKMIKKEMFSSVDLYSFVSPSAYDTAWVAMIPDPRRLDRPLFKECLDWVLNNQNEEGFWGEPEVGGLPTIDCLSATLACMVALKMWNVGTNNVHKGLGFFHANARKLLIGQGDRYPRWFVIVFPAMVEHARAAGLEVIFPDGLVEVMKDIFNERQRILEMEELVDQFHYPPLISYLEALPPSYDIDQEEILRQLSEDGSLFKSPSATAKAFMATGNERCITYLDSLVRKCGYGVPPLYPMDEELVKLCMVNQLERLGLAEHFVAEIDDTLSHFYRNYMNQDSQAVSMNVNPVQIFKDSLAFWLLRMHGYPISPWRICWFLHREDILDHIKGNYECFLSAMLNVYRATDLMFLGENELEKARSFSKKLLYKAMSLKSTKNNLSLLQNSQRVVEHELRRPWLARLDHLEHRVCIEESETSDLWMGKASFYRLSCLHNDALMQLAVENYKSRQLIFQKDLQELQSWSKDSGLTDIGFGREKTTYCYFAAAASFLSYSSDIRIAIAKSAIIVTIADDFFDMEGSMDELQILTKAVGRWDGKGLSRHSKIIFDTLDNLVRDIAGKHFEQQRHDVTKILRDIWYQTFASWLTEAKWSRSGYIPSIDEYLKVGMISIAVHTIALPALCLMNPSLPIYMMKHLQFNIITKLVMVSTRLINDIQSYQKEQEDGKMNIVYLYMKENPDANIQDSIAYIRKILDKKKKELLECVLRDGIGDMPKTCKQVYLSALKIFQMFYNSTNGFDSETEMLHDINRAIYHPLELQVQHSMPHKLKLPQRHSGSSAVLFSEQSRPHKPIIVRPYGGSSTVKIHNFRQPGRMHFMTNSRFDGWLGGPKFSLPKFTLRIV